MFFGKGEAGLMLGDLARPWHTVMVKACEVAEVAWRDSYNPLAHAFGCHLGTVSAPP